MESLKIALRLIFESWNRIVSFLNVIILRSFIKDLKIVNSVLYKCWIFNTGNNKVFFKCGKAIQSRVYLQGISNEFKLNGTIRSSNINIEGCNCILEIKEGCFLSNVNIVLKGSNCIIIIDEDTCIGKGTEMVCMGISNSIHLGRDCMIASDVDVWATDSHPIVDIRTRQIVNPSCPIFIKNHVWVGKKATILKGTTIGDHAIIGMGAVVAKDVPANSVAVGNPARIIRDNISWERDHIKK